MSPYSDGFDIHDSRKTVLADEFQKPYFLAIKEFIFQEKNA
jgi:hypothetical protein